MARKEKAADWFPFVYCIELNAEKAVKKAFETEECFALYRESKGAAVQCARKKPDYSALTAECAAHVCPSVRYDVTAHSVGVDWLECKGCAGVRRRTRG